ncbi:endonuclease [Natronosporangium hydrolyticum]|uniref:Endonuclease n=1 Tax=Natronosporangium hydrolyticum TaxID=2811111 RepID=A0A895Y6G6_9ACTN|nr:endonuclease [Natronosporangium hydrolyticum]QSB13347.1 endonuclease [Natronosporangium hydrolyticum]
MRRARSRSLVAAASAATLLVTLAASAASAQEPAPSAEVACPTSPVPGFDLSTTESYPAQREVTATSPESAVTDLQLTVSPPPESGEITLTEVIPAEGPGGTAAATLSVTGEVSAGTYTATITAVTDDDPAAGDCVAAIEVMPLVPIGAVQGSIADDQTNFTSPLLGERVAVRGVVTQVTMEGNGAHGFFLQERAGETDGDPQSSDGVFIYNGDFTTLRTEVEGPARDQVGADWQVAIGDEIVLRGEVGQYFGMTQFGGGGSFVWEVTDTGLDVPSTVAIAEVDPPDDAADALRYFRRHLGMQLTVPAGAQVVNGRDVFSGTDAEVWAIRGDHPVAQREEPYSQRVFRDAHPLDNQPETAFDDGNGYRFVLGSFGVKGSTGDPDAVLAPARTFDTITEANRGGVYLSFGKYTVNVVDQLALDTSGPDPAANHPVEPADREREFDIAAYNVENLYDYRDNPNSGCDFPGNPGCFDEHGGSVTGPFDYVPDSDAEYQARLQRMAEQIRLDLHSPDIVMIQETEAQDVCTVAAAWTPETGAELGADRLECDLTNPGEANTRSDGRPDSLLELALVIAEQGGPEYQATFNLDSGDLRGITTAYLYRTDRVELLPAAAADPVLGADPQVAYDAEPLPYNTDVTNPKALNTRLPDHVADACTGSGPTQCDGVNVFSRAPQVALFRVWRGEPGLASWTDLYLVNNHQSAGPDRRVLQRTEQATYNARIAEAVLAADPAARVVVGGDLNVFPRPDDPFAPGTAIPGVGEGPSDQLAALYDSPLTNLYDTMVAEYPAIAYTFGFQGQAQTLDHLWVSPTLLAELLDARSAKINVDWPADARGEDPAYGRFGVSDHDPESARFTAEPTFTSVRALLSLLVTEESVPPSVSSPVSTLLTNAERLSQRGQSAAAGTLLETAAELVDRHGRLGTIDPEVAAALREELALLSP